MLGESGPVRVVASMRSSTSGRRAELLSFVLAIIQADRSVSHRPVLRAQADEMRIKRKQLAKEQAQKAPVKMLLPWCSASSPPCSWCLGPAVITLDLHVSRSRAGGGAYRDGRRRPRCGRRRGSRTTDGGLSEAGTRPGDPRDGARPSGGSDPDLGARRVAVLWGLMVGLGRISDNSFFTHLQTGRLILADGRIPTTIRTRSPRTRARVCRLAGIGPLRRARRHRQFAAIRLPWVARAVLGLSRGGSVVRPSRDRPGARGLGRAGGWYRHVGRTSVVFGLVFLVWSAPAEGGLDPRWLVRSCGYGQHARLVPLAWSRCWSWRRASSGRGARRSSCGRSRGASSASPSPRSTPRPPLVPFRCGRHPTAAFENVIDWQPPNFVMFGEKIFLVQLFVAAVLLVRRPVVRAALPLAVSVRWRAVDAQRRPPAWSSSRMAAAVGRAVSLEGRVGRRCSPWPRDGGCRVAAASALGEAVRRAN